MPDLSEFYRTFLKSIKDREEKQPEEFYGRFNNASEFRRRRNCLPRTDLMLGTGISRSGLLTEAVQLFLANERELEICYERYMDIIAFAGNWWTGKRIAALIMEHETDITEFKGTVSDLVRYQARQKIGIFYDTSEPNSSERFQLDIEAIFEEFRLQGFSESQETEYLIVFGPQRLTSGEGIGVWPAMWFTHGSCKRPTWLSTASRAMQKSA